MAGRQGCSVGFVVALVCWTTSGAQETGGSCVDDEFSSRNTVALDCSLRDAGSGLYVWCDELSRALDYAPFISFPFYVHTRYELVGVEGEAVDADDDGGVTMETCLELSKVTTRRVVLDEPWKNVTITFMEPFKVFMLIGAKEMLLETSYNESVPVGYVRLDVACWRGNRTSDACVKEVRIAQQLMRPVFDTNPYLPSYWEEVQEVRTDLLGEHDGRLRVDFQRDYNLSAEVYVAPFVRGTYQLEELRVTGVNLSRLSEYLGDLPHLRRLDLSEDDLETMAPEMFLNVSNLMELNLARNNLQNVSEGLSYLKNLTSLDLSWNPIDTSKEGVKNLVKVLKTLHNLRWLFLAGINFRDLGALRTLLGRGGTKLLGLDLSFCGLTSLGGEAAAEIFEAQADLRTLSLAGNKLGKVHPRVFLPLSNLRELNLSSCGMTESPELQFSPHTALAILDMSHNNISLTKSVVSCGCVSSLDLSNNSISSWTNADAFVAGSDGASCWPNVSDEGTAVRSVNLSHNQISTLSVEMMGSLQRLYSIDLGGNRIDCSLCTTPGLQAWLRRARESERPRVLAGRDGEGDDGDGSPLICSAPVNKFGSPVTEVLFDSAACESKHDPVDYALVFGVPLTALAALVACVLVMVYLYRFELTYLMHLVKIKRRRAMAMHYASQNYQYDAFVCYSGSDRAWVIGKLLPRMERHPGNYRMCLHERDFVLGSFITSNIVASMQNSRFTIVVLSNSFVQSQWCRWELEMANHKLLEDDTDFLVLLELERLTPGTVPRHLKYLMDTRTYLEWPDDAADKGQEEEELWKRLETALGSSISNSRMLPSAAKPKISAAAAAADTRPAPAV